MQAWLGKAHCPCANGEGVAAGALQRTPVSLVTTGMIASRALRHANSHLLEIDEHIAAQRNLIGELRAAGRETAASERLLQSMLEAQMMALAHRRVVRTLRRRGPAPGHRAPAGPLDASCSYPSAAGPR